MNIALFGATGTIGQRLLAEALQRGHRVTAIVRDPSRVALSHANLRVVTGDILDAERVAETTVGQDLVISAYGPRDAASESVVAAAHALIEGLTRAGVKRLLVVGGAGSLEVAPGVQLVDTPEFPAGWKSIALAHRDTLGIYQASDLDWTYVSPPMFIEPGERTGQYRTETDQLLSDASGQSRISTEDYAVALLDEAEKPQFIRRRFTVAY